MYADWHRKSPNLANEPPSASGSDLAACSQCSTGTEPPTESRSSTRVRAAARSMDPNVLPNVVADAVIEAVRCEGHDLLLTEGEVFFYADGVWRPIGAAEQQWLQTLIQKEFERFAGFGKLGQLATAWKRLTEHPKLYRRTVPWTSTGVLATSNGVLDVLSRTLSPHSPHHFIRRKIGAGYEPRAECPQFLSFLNRIFIDREPTEVAACLAILQSFFGASLAVALLSREERKALILVVRPAQGKPNSLVSFDCLSAIRSPLRPSRRCLSASAFFLYDASAWIRDDAINEGDDLDPQRFKTIVTGEPIDIERKHRDAVRGVGFAIPVVLTANALPRAHKSDALFNRSLVVELTNVISEEDAFRFRTELGIPRGQSFAAFIFGQEGPGILNWALDGLDRLLDRGAYELPDAVRAAVQRFKDDNNPVGEWARAARPARVLESRAFGPALRVPRLATRTGR